MGAKRCSKKIDDGPINMALSKKKNCEHTHELINMNPTIFIIDNNVGLFSQCIQNYIQTSLIFVENVQNELTFMQIKLGNPLVCHL
jgi:hypothetical protein